MTYDNPHLIDLLAGRYVLSVLRGAARRRFDAIARGNFGARRAIADWEERLAPLSMQLQPITPPPQVWSQIQQRIGVPVSIVGMQTRRWQAIAAAMALIAVGLASYIALRVPNVEIQVESMPGYVAVLTDQDAKPLWVFNTYPGENRMRASAISTLKPGPDKSYELWMVPKDGTAPVSLGVLPSAGSTEVKLSEQLLSVLANSSALAVSLEAKGGSPNGKVSGPVLFTAPLVRPAV